MAWSTPRTFVAAAVLTAAQLNENRDNWNAQFPLGTPAWTSYTPTLTQSATVTKTTTYAKYTQVGKKVTGNVALAVTGAGTAANQVVVGLPVTAATSGFVIGSGLIADSSATTNYQGILYIASTTTGILYPGSGTTGNTALGANVFTAGLANTDLVTYCFHYEAA